MTDRLAAIKAALAVLEKAELEFTLAGHCSIEPARATVYWPSDAYHAEVSWDDVCWLVAEVEAARAEAARLRDILTSIVWHQDGDSNIYVCALCRGMHPSCEKGGRWVAGTTFGHKAGCALAALEGDHDRE